jgi:hypothetical protein
MIASTILKGKLVLRMCVINPRTTPEDIAETVQLLNRIAYRLPGQRLEERKYLLLGHDQAEPEKVPLAS